MREVAKQVWECFEGLIGGIREAFTVRHKVMSWLVKPTSNSYLDFVLRTLPSLICWNLWKMRNMRIFDARLRSKVTILEVCWKCPSQSVVADGCLRGNPGRSGGGGVFRDYFGRFLLGFSCCFGEITSLHAELKALHFGTQLSVSRGLVKLHLESDSLVLARIIQGKVRCPWQLQRELQDLLQYERYFEAVTHCF
nr:uncharacterized protein LOC113729280 [Coffea arabica]